MRTTWDGLGVAQLQAVEDRDYKSLAYSLGLYVPDLLEYATDLPQAWRLKLEEDKSMKTASGLGWIATRHRWPATRPAPIHLNDQLAHLVITSDYQIALASNNRTSEVLTVHSIGDLTEEGVRQVYNEGRLPPLAMVQSTLTQLLASAGVESAGQS